MNRPAANVLGVSVDAVNMTEAVAHIKAMLGGAEKGYICCADVHGIMEAQRRPELANAYANSAMTLPDGMPLVWMGWTQHFRSMERVCGPDLMMEVFTRPEFRDTTHYLYGGCEMVAEQLRDSLLRKNPDARIVGVRTPPFRDLTAAEEQELIEDIAAVEPDVVWVGISCPKQELFMARYLQELDTKLMFGVGAAFDYHTGRIRDCAPWMKRAGMQWLHRLLQDPKRLWKRYLRNNPAFIWRVALQFAGVMKQSSLDAAPASAASAADTTIR